MANPEGADGSRVVERKSVTGGWRLRAKELAVGGRSLTIKCPLLSVARWQLEKFATHLTEWRTSAGRSFGL